MTSMWDRDWTRYDRVDDLMREAERPWLDNYQCADCESQFGRQHRCCMRGVA